MRTKGSILQKFLCFFGWHKWYKHESKYEDNGWHVFIPGVILILASGIIAQQTEAFFIRPENLNPDLFIGSIIATVVCVLYLPYGLTLHAGPFNGSCLYCHKHITYLADQKAKIEDEKNYEECLIDLATASYDQQGHPRKKED